MNLVVYHSFFAPGSQLVQPARSLPFRSGSQPSSSMKGGSPWLSPSWITEGRGGCWSTAASAMSAMKERMSASLYSSVPGGRALRIAAAKAPADPYFSSTVNRAATRLWTGGGIGQPALRHISTPVLPVVLHWNGCVMMSKPRCAVLGVAALLGLTLSAYTASAGPAPAGTRGYAAWRAAQAGTLERLTNRAAPAPLPLHRLPPREARW